MTRNSRRAWLVGLLAFGLVGTVGAQDDDYSGQWGPAIGAPLPLLDALDQDGNRRNFDDLAGQRGLLLFFSRSTDW